MPDKYIIGSPDGDEVNLTLLQCKTIAGLYAISLLKAYSLSGSADELGIKQESWDSINYFYKNIMHDIERDINIEFTIPYPMPIIIQKVLDGEIKPYKQD